MKRFAQRVKVLHKVRTLLKAGMLAVCLATYQRPEVTEVEARAAALRAIENAQPVIKIDAKKLPPLSRTASIDGFSYSAWDESQNISIFVHVSKTGEAEISSLSIDEERRRNERARQYLQMHSSPSEQQRNPKDLKSTSEEK